MKKIDTTQWGEFSLKELGFTNFHGSRLKKCDREIGTIPFVTAGKENQGIVGSIGNSVTTYNNAITVDMFGNVFYHRGAIAGDDNIYFFVNDKISEKAKLYIVSTIKATLGDTFAYVDQFRQDNADALKVKLPIDANGDPDWVYMEDYMKALEKRVTCSVTALNTLLGGVRRNKQINVSKWQYFKVGKLFDVVKGRRLTKADMKPGNINYIGATAFNNGITAKIANNEHIHPAGTITVCYNGSIGQTFYQTTPFWATDDVNVLYPKFEMKQQIAFFIMPIIRTIGQKYAFVDKWTKDKMAETNIPLPVTANGEPDFEYMEQYMRNIEKRVQAAIREIA